MKKLGYSNIDVASPKTVTLNQSAEDVATNKDSQLEDDPLS